MLPHLNELGMGTGGKGGLLLKMYFTFKGCRSGSWSGLPMTKVTKEDNNSVCRASHTELLVWWNGKITPANTLSAAMKAAQGDVWLSSKCIGMWVVETYCFFPLLKITALYLLVWFTFPPFPLYLRRREMTPWGGFPFDMKKTQLGMLKRWWTNLNTIL